VRVLRRGLPGAAERPRLPLTGPSVADIDGQPGEEVVAATASPDLQAFNALGLPLSGHGRS
jgi:hypothetical protein